MKVFLSYGDASDQVTALRLQALAAVNGLTVYVPPAYTRRANADLLDLDVRQKLDEAEVVLGVVGAGISGACSLELSTGMTLRKSMIVMSSPAYSSTLRPLFGENLVEIDPAHADGTEIEMVRHLKTINARQNAKNALPALGTLALGLLILAPADPS